MRSVELLEGDYDEEANEMYSESYSESDTEDSEDQPVLEAHKDSDTNKDSNKCQWAKNQTKPLVVKNVVAETKDQIFRIAQEAIPAHILKKERPRDSTFGEDLLVSEALWTVANAGVKKKQEVIQTICEVAEANMSRIPRTRTQGSIAAVTKTPGAITAQRSRSVAGVLSHFFLR